MLPQQVQSSILKAGLAIDQASCYLLSVSRRETQSYEIAIFSNYAKVQEWGYASYISLESVAYQTRGEESYRGWLTDWLIDLSWGVWVDCSDQGLPSCSHLIYSGKLMAHTVPNFSGTNCIIWQLFSITQYHNTNKRWTINQITPTMAWWALGLRAKGLPEACLSPLHLKEWFAS